MHKVAIKERVNVIGRSDYVVWCEKCGTVDKTWDVRMAESISQRHQRGAK